MRRSSNAVLTTQTSEPLIVVEDSNHDYEDRQDEGLYSRQSSEDESPTMNLNPYLLSPYAREIRKHSLPTPQCSGITASQVRRLSERGETVGPGPRQTEFLATLSTAPAPTPGGRRHSVVTISKVPSTLFGRNRRESVAAFSSGSGFPGRVLQNRRESIACPPSTEPRGSVHNLQLDIMDDIVQARKVRMKLWNTSNEKVCEVEPLDESGTGVVQRYTHSSSRRYSDFVGTTLAPIPSSSKRRASELPQPPPTTSSCATTSASKIPSTGIVCTNTDLISILSLSTSASEINQSERAQSATANVGAKGNLSEKRSRLKSNRSNSFDVSILHSIEKNSETNEKSPAPSNWFIRRHQPKNNNDKDYCNTTTSVLPIPKVSIVKDTSTTRSPKKVVDSEPNTVMWDERSGSLVDAHALGSAIEVFLRKGSPESSNPPSNTSPNKSGGKNNKSPSGKSKTSWFANNKGDDDSTETCDSSICSTLKDLFVK